MRILMTSYEFPPVGGGGGQVAHGLARGLAAMGDEVDLVTMHFPGLARVEHQPGLTVHRVPSLRRDLHSCTVPQAASYLLAAAPVIGKLLLQRRYDLVHSHFILPDGPLGLFAAFAARRPLVITAHGTDVPEHNPDRVRSLHAVLRPVWQRLTSRAACIVCPGELLRTNVTRANPRARTVVIPNGLDPRRFDPGRPRSKRLLVVTRMVRSKGVQYLLQALQGFSRDYEVVLVGDGAYLPDLKRLAAELRVSARFTGWLPNDSVEIKELYETSSMFVLPSDADNCPLALLEAMAAGLAIVTTRDTGCADVVGETARLVPRCDPKAIRAALDDLSDRPELAAALGAAARARVERCFGWPAVVERYREIYLSHARAV
jgi:glycosyltransferase involved in cell wall biosynthesis